jgi:hypothetical protein
MRNPVLLVALLLVLVPITHAQKMQVTVLESVGEGQSVDVPARLACLPSTNGPMCAARGAETVNTYSIRIKARVTSSGAGMWLTCQLLKKGDEKHCTKLVAGTYRAEPKGNDKLIVYAWTNPIYIGNLSKATKLEFKVGGRELDQDEEAGATK